MRRRANLGALAGTVVLLGVLASSAVLGGQGAAAKPKPKPKPVPIKLDQHRTGVLVLSTRTYRLILSKRNGAVLDLYDLATKRHLVTSTNGCEWGVAAVNDPAYIGGCTFTPTSGARFSYS